MSKRAASSTLVREGESPEDLGAYYEQWTKNEAFGVSLYKTDDGPFINGRSLDQVALLAGSFPLDPDQCTFGAVKPTGCVVDRESGIITKIAYKEKILHPTNFRVLSVLKTAQRKGCNVVCEYSSGYLGFRPFAVENNEVSIDTRHIVLPDTGAKLPALTKGIDNCMKVLLPIASAAQMQTIAKDFMGILGLFKSSDNFITPPFSKVLSSADATKMAANVATARQAPSVSPTVIELYTSLQAILMSGLSMAEKIEALQAFTDTKDVTNFFISFGKTRLPYVPKQSDAGKFFTDTAGTKLVPVLLSEVENDSHVLMNAGFVLSPKQMEELAKPDLRVYRVNPATGVFVSRKEGKTTKYEKKEWESLAAKDFKDLASLLRDKGTDKGSASASKKDKAIDDAMEVAEEL